MALIRVADQKALPASRAPEPPLYENGPVPRLSRFSNRAAAQHTQAYGGTEAIGYVMDCIEQYSVTAANAPYHFERDNGKRLRMPGEAATPEARGEAPAELVELLKRPNRIMDWGELIELSVIDFLLAGEFIWFKNGTDRVTGRCKELYRLPPSLVDVEPGRTAPAGYIYTPPGGGKDIHLRPDEVVHVKRPNPHDPWRGLGVIAGDPRMYDVALSALDSMALYYEQGTKLSGVLETDRSVPPSTMTKIKAEIDSLWRGVKNFHRVATLERGLKFKPISADARQADYKNTRELTRTDIAQAFKIPLPLLGAVGNADRQAVAEAQRIFDNKVMRPFLNRIQQQVSYQLTQAWGVNLVIEHSYIIPYEDKLDLGQAMAAIPGVRVREVRALIDLPPLGEGDPEVAWVDEVILNVPGQNMEEGEGAEGEAHADRPLASEPGRPPKGPTAIFPRKPGALPKSANVVTPEVAAKAVQDALEGDRG